MTTVNRIVVTPGEPAGIGPDLVLELARHDWPFEILAVADPAMLAERAALLGLDIALSPADCSLPAVPHTAGKLPVDPVTCPATVVPGQLDTTNAAYVRATLDQATDHCLAGRARALVTAPVHKAVLSETGSAFSGHTEYLAARCGAPPPVMLLTTADGTMRVALATMHLPLIQVPTALTKDWLAHIFQTTAEGLSRDFGIAEPRLLVAGLNPHAGEQATLGDEEEQIIAPAIESARRTGLHIEGPLSADTLFIDENRCRGDVVIAMYHDQGLPVIKYAGFGRVVNVTLGLPIIRTSVDHGTALALAGTGQADTGSLFAAVESAAAIATSRGT